MRNPGREAGVLRCGVDCRGADQWLRLGWRQVAGRGVEVPGDGGDAARVGQGRRKREEKGTGDSVVLRAAAKQPKGR